MCRCGVSACGGVGSRFPGPWHTLEVNHCSIFPKVALHVLTSRWLTGHRLYSWQYLYRDLNSPPWQQKRHAKPLCCPCDSNTLKRRSVVCFELLGLLTAGSSQHREKRPKQDAWGSPWAFWHIPPFLRTHAGHWKTCGTMRSATITTQVSSRAQAKSRKPSCTCFMRGYPFPCVFVYGSHRYTSSPGSSERGPVTVLSALLCPLLLLVLPGCAILH